VIFLPFSFISPRRATVRSGAEIGLLSLMVSLSPGAPSGDFLLAPTCPIEKVILRLGFLYLMPGSDEGVAKDKVFAPTQNQTLNSGSKAAVRYPLGYRFTLP